MVGDKMSDLQAAKKVGVHKLFMLKNDGENSRQKLLEDINFVDFLLDVAKLI